jgi:hypothetical protein
MQVWVIEERVEGEWQVVEAFATRDTAREIRRRMIGPYTTRVRKYVPEVVA